MPSRLLIAVGCLAGLLTLQPVSVVADDAASATKLFDDLFGQEVKRVTQSPDNADDVELAGTLLKAAGTADDKPHLQKLLCDWAYALASKDVSGFGTAVDAMKLLAEKQAEHAEAADRKIGSLYQRGYERATGDQKTEAGNLYLEYLMSEVELKLAVKAYDDALQLLRKARPVAIIIKSPLKDVIQSQLEWYAPLAVASQRAEIAERKVKTNPWDKTARTQLVSLYVEDLDDPAAATDHVKLGGDETQQKLVPLAAKPVGELESSQLRELGDWYETLGKRGSDVARHASLTRAVAYYNRYLEVNTEEGVTRTAIGLALKRVEDALASIQAPGNGTAVAGAASGKTIDLLAKIDPDRDRMMGSWSKQQGKLLKGDEPRFGAAVLRAPYSIDGDYELEVKFIRDEGNGSIDIVLPVASSMVRFSLDHRGEGKTGLSDLDGQDPRRNPTGVNLALRNNKVYTVEATVKTTEGAAGAEAHILVKVDGTKVVDWKGDPSKLSLAGRLRIDEKVTGLILDDAGATIGSMKLKMLTGEATELTNTPQQFGPNNPRQAEGNNNNDPRNRDDVRRERERQFEDFFRRFRGGGRR